MADCLFCKISGVSGFVAMSFARHDDTILYISLYMCVYVCVCVCVITQSSGTVANCLRWCDNTKLRRKYDLIYHRQLNYFTHLNQCRILFTNKNIRENCQQLDAIPRTLRGP